VAEDRAEIRVAVRARHAVPVDAHVALIAGALSQVGDQLRGLLREEAERGNDAVGAEIRRGQIEVLRKFGLVLLELFPKSNRFSDALK
jgi:hypothetical protein